MMTAQHRPQLACVCSRVCVCVLAGVRVPNVPAGDHFLFIYASAKEKKPSKVLHLHPGRYTLKVSQPSARPIEAPCSPGTSGSVH
jgi:hypothetical protein